MADTNSDNLLVQVVIAERPASAGAVFGFFGSAAKLPASRPGMNMLPVSEAGGRRQLLTSDPQTGGKAVANLVLFMRAEPWPLTLTLARAKTDADGHAWDLVLTGKWTIVGAAQFAQEYAMEAVAVGAPLDASEVQSWAQARIEHRMREQIETLALEDLRDRKSRPASWWEKRLNEWFAQLGLTASVTRMEMYSATAADAEEGRHREKHEREVQASRAVMREQEVAERSAEAEFELRKSRIETDREVAADLRAAQLEELAVQRQARRDEAERARLAAAQKLERLRFAHETDMAAIGAKVAEERIHRQKEADARFQENREQARLRQAEHLQKLQAQKEQLQADVEAGRYRAAAEKAEMQRRIAELESAQSQARQKQAQQVVEHDLMLDEARLRRDQLQAAHEQALAAAGVLSAANLAMLARQEQASNELHAKFAGQREAQAESLYKANLERIRCDHSLSTEEFQIRIECEKTKLEAARRSAAEEERSATVKAERDKALFEAQMEILRRQLNRLDEANVNEASVAQKVANYHAGMEDTLPNIPQTIAELLDADPMKAHQAAETITQQWHTPAASLQSLGYAVTAQSLVDRWKYKAKGDGNPVRLNKQELTTRDIGVSSVKILKIHSTLHFSLSSRRAGYATVINLGTSGRFWLLCPGLCSIEQARIEPNRKYELPGRELFPYDEGDLCEDGPAGWEHLVAIVSNHPLIDPAWLRAAGRPIAEIAAADLERMVARLDERSGEWSVGLLSFVVEW